MSISQLNDLHIPCSHSSFRINAWKGCIVSLFLLIYIMLPLFSTVVLWLGKIIPLSLHLEKRKVCVCVCGGGVCSANLSLHSSLGCGLYELSDFQSK